MEDIDVSRRFYEGCLGQKVLRVYDPDGHILEIGESMEAAVVRLHAQGMTVEGICQKTGMPREFIEGAIGEQGK